MKIDQKIEYNFYPISLELNMGTPSPANPQVNAPAVAIENSNILNSANGSVVGTGTVQSPNFLAGASGAGWRLDSNGNLEANAGNFRGDITGASGAFSGTLDVGGDDATSFHVDSAGGIWSGASVANKATAPFRVNSAGDLTATSGSIANWTISSTSIYTGTEDHAGYTTNAGDLTIYSDGTNASIHAKEFYIDANGAIFATSATLSGAITTGVGSSIASDYLSGVIAQANLNVSNRGWSQTCAFSVTDADTIAWGAGTFTSADGTAYSISASNTGNMVAKTYIYLDTAVSTTAYQTTTTATTAVGTGKVLVAIAQNATNEATYKVMSGQGGENIDAANIVTGSITANEIAASTITAGKMSVSTLSSIVADLGAVTAGTITLNTAGWIKGGQTDYNTGTGFFLGYKTAAYKFSIGNSSDISRLLTWDGTDLVVNGSIISGQDTFGNGADGDVTISSNTSLTADMFYNNLTINTGITLSTKGFRIFAKGTLNCVGTGKIASNGGAGGNGGNGTNSNTGGAAGSAGVVDYSSGTLPIPLAGRTGGEGADEVDSVAGVGANGVDAAKSLGAAGTNGGRGGDGLAGSGQTVGAAGGTGGSKTGTVLDYPKSYTTSINLFDKNGTAIAQHTISASSGGGGGGGKGPTNTSSGGGGGGSGSPGGFVWVAAKTITNINVEAKGGTGGNGGNSSSDAGSYKGGVGAAGAGGSGGVIILIYGILTASSLDAAGGAAGALGSLGYTTNSTAAQAGNAGTTIQINI